MIFRHRFIWVTMASLMIGGAVMASAAMAASAVSESSVADTAGLGFAVKLFQKYISPADGDRCPMAPTCSAYAATAVRRHGGFVGSVMACDRLMRCGRDELKVAPTIRVGERLQCVDRVSDNDFWWREPSYLEK